MSLPPNVIPRVVVEDCEIIKVSEVLRCLRLGLQFDTVATRGRGQRFSFSCPRCSRRAFKLYRPVGQQDFACGLWHSLSYTSVQKHDARLDRLLNVPDGVLVKLVVQDKNMNMTWRLLAIRAGYIRFGSS